MIDFANLLQKQIFGKNYDWESSKKLTKSLTTSIFHFEDGKIIANINYPGVNQFETAK
ncbi:MAG: hypothetical protein WC860_06435 [Candidatus Margulisiibacteriota bacterium]|jgi:hypothetical protein